MKHLLIAFLAGLAFLPGVHADDDSASQPASVPSVLVVTATAEQRTVDETLPIFGTVQVAPGMQRTLAAPRESRIAEVTISSGETVSKGQVLLTLAPTPASRAAFVQAQSAETYAETALSHTRVLYKEHLATRNQVAAAEQALSDAQVTFINAKQAGGTGQLVLRAPASGIVSGIAVSTGEQVAANSALVTLELRGTLTVRLGVPPEEIGEIRTSARITLHPVYDSSRTVQVRISNISSMVDAGTGLADVFARLPAQAQGFLPGTSVQGTLTLKHVQGLAVPRTAVLRDGNQAYVFIVRKQVAQRVNVSVLADDGHWIAVKGKISAGAAVVTLGNYELANGMKVRETSR